MPRVGFYYRNKASGRLYMVDSVGPEGYDYPQVIFFSIGGTHAHSDGIKAFMREFQEYNP